MVKEENNLDLNSDWLLKEFGKRKNIDIKPMFFVTNFNDDQDSEFFRIIDKTLSENNVIPVIKWRSRTDGGFIIDVYNFNGTVIDSYLALRRRIQYLTYENLLEVNNKARSMFENFESKSLWGIKDSEKVKSILSRVENSIVYKEEQLPTLTLKAAKLWYEIATNQAFHNGNKRTSIMASLTFLEQNHIKFNAKKELYNNMYEITKKVANKEISEPFLARYLENSSNINFESMENLFYEKE